MWDKHTCKSKDLPHFHTQTMEEKRLMKQLMEFEDYNGIVLDREKLLKDIDISDLIKDSHKETEEKN